MGQVTATAETTVAAPPADAVAALGDYEVTRPGILSAHYSDYAVEQGGQGDGTVVTWRLHATEKRLRHVVADITTTSDPVTATDRHSSMVTTWRVVPLDTATNVPVLPT